MSPRIPIEITIVVDGEPDLLLQQVITQAAERASREVPTVQPTFVTISLEEWTNVYQSDTPMPYHDLWRRPELP